MKKEETILIRWGNPVAEIISMIILNISNLGKSINEK